MVVGFVAAAGDEDEGLFGEGSEGDLGGGEVSGEIVVVVFDAVEIAEILEAVRQALEVGKSGGDLGSVGGEEFGKGET